MSDRYRLLMDAIVESMIGDSHKALAMIIATKANPSTGELITTIDSLQQALFCDVADLIDEINGGNHIDRCHNFTLEVTELAELDQDTVVLCKIVVDSNYVASSTPSAYLDFFDVLHVRKEAL